MLALSDSHLLVQLVASGTRVGLRRLEAPVGARAAARGQRLTLRRIGMVLPRKGARCLEFLDGASADSAQPKRRNLVPPVGSHFAAENQAKCRQLERIRELSLTSGQGDSEKTHLVHTISLSCTASPKPG